ncbi:nuclear transport factor 2 family protein [Marinomonas transparens]|uniref:Nuclear transport factor 2 family protein n=1 Tax=Marinomonas transparens TaxID=2795388 RepID=A0A934N113_9GAMM|nr:nuclear transport factor 2 family protein [Marinomonas transparens]MBJ7536213.1 nuclear transport factor 2 family protein [Marinomonas transparens]
MTNLEQQNAQLQQRLSRLESERDISACINRYMDLCDHLNPQTPLDELGDLFTQDARWEGKGARYAKSFGGYQGRDAILDMLAKYTVEPPHFALNVHYLASQVIRVDGDVAFGSWNMLQVSTFSAGGSHLNSARLSVQFRQQEGVWRMSHFETENLFSRPVGGWNNDAELPVPDTKD